MKLSKYIVASLLCALISPAPAQSANTQPTQTTRENNGNPVRYDSQGLPIERKLDNNGNIISPPERASSVNSNTNSPAQPTTQSRVCRTPTFSKSKSGQRLVSCAGKLANGLVSLTAPSKRAEVTTYIGQFAQGRMVGNFYVQDHTSGSVFVGTVNGLERLNGTTSFTDGSSEYGGYQSDSLYQGQIKRPGPYGKTITLEIENGQQVGPSESQQIALIKEQFRPKHIIQMSEVRLKSGICLADMPRVEFRIEATMPGRCKDGNYNGKATLILIPKDGSGRKVAAEVKYQNGLLIGQSTLKYGAEQGTFRGTLVNWQPDQGELTSPIGNDTYAIASYSGGQVTAERRQQREPSFGKLLGQTILSSIVRAVNDCMHGGCQQEMAAEQARRDRKAQERRDADAYAQQQSRVAQEQRQNSIARQQENDRYAQDQTETRQRGLDAIEEARRTQLAEPDQVGNPILPPAPPVQIARADPPPVFAVETNQPEEQTRPTLNTNIQGFGGNAETQGQPPVITTRPPELPAPQPAEPTLPDPIRGVEPIAPQVPAPVQVVDLPDPITPQSDGVPPPLAPARTLADPIAPPVQPTLQSDTLGTAPAPSNPSQSPASESGNRPNSPNIQPVDAGGARQPVNQVTQTQSRLSIPGIPRITAPTNQGELRQPIPLEWTQQAGATYYILAVEDHTSPGFPVDDERVGPPPFRRTFAAGHYFTFDVQACNQTGCSQRSVNGSFRTGGGVAFNWDCNRLVGQGALGRTYNEDEKKFVTQCATPTTEGQCAINSRLPDGPGTVPKAMLAQWLAANAAEANQNRLNLTWFGGRVREGGPWDYKKNGQRGYADFGNYHYGYVGTAAGYSKETLLRFAGGVQIVTNIKNNSSIGTGFPFGRAPYGDDPNDQYQILNGINDYFRCHN